MAETPNYWDYLHLETLLSLQSGLDPKDSEMAPDELHFIITHQVFELWFKLALAELRHARDYLAKPAFPDEQVPHVVHHLRRVNRVLHLAINTFEVMETLTPQDFLGFRDKLTPASGFQSFQLREIELLMGLSDAQRVKYGGTDPIEHIQKLAQGEAGRFARQRLAEARTEQSLRQALHRWLYRTPIQGSTPDQPDDDATVIDFLERYLAAVADHHTAQADRLIAVSIGEPDDIRARFARNTETARRFLLAQDIAEPQAQALRRRARAGLLFIESYRQLPLLAWPRLLIDTVVEFEEQMVLFRTRHARMVERVIGRRIGTGGSSGVDYLDQTTRIRIFSDLWTVRTLMLPRTLLPTVHNLPLYGFAETYSKG